MLRKKLWLIGILGLFATATTAAEGSHPYKIGVVYAITGPASFLGEPERNAAVLVAEQINAEGGINGHPIQLIVYDSEGDSTKSVLAMKRLINQDRVVALIGTSLSGETLSVIPTIQEAEVPFVAPTGSARIVEPVRERKWVFKTSHTDALIVRATYQWMKKTGLRTLALLTEANSYGDSAREQLEKQEAASGVRIVAKDRFGSKDVDMTAQLTKIKAANPQAFIVWGTNPGPAIITRNARALNMPQAFIGCYGFASDQFIKLAGPENAEGIMFALPKVQVADQLPGSDVQKPVILQVNEDYRRRFGQPLGFFGAIGWDAMMLVVNALKAAGPPPDEAELKAYRVKVRDLIESTRDFVGMDGVFNMSPNDHNGLSLDSLVMVQVRNGQWKLGDVR